MGAHPPVPLSLKHTAILPQQPQLILQIQTQLIGELVEAYWYVC